MKIEYMFSMEGCETVLFTVDSKRSSSKNYQEPHDGPDWAALSFEQCSCCSLPRGSHKYCPVAIDLFAVLKRFSALLSYQVAEVTVFDSVRTYHKTCSVQEGLKSLMGLIMATSSCPTLEPLGFMAEFHLPFANYQESLYRIVGAYLIEQYYSNNQGKVPDLELKGLAKRFQDLATLNQCFAQRVRRASEKDASLNAIIHLFALSNLVSTSIDEGLPELRTILGPPDQ